MKLKIFWFQYCKCKYIFHLSIFFGIIYDCVTIASYLLEKITQMPLILIPTYTSDDLLNQFFKMWITFQIKGFLWLSCVSSLESRKLQREKVFFIVNNGFTIPKNLQNTYDTRVLLTLFTILLCWVLVQK